jgi:hypothetical protein
MIPVAIGFIAGIFVGVLAAIVTAVAILNRPPTKREITYSAIGAGRVRTTGDEDLFNKLSRLM